MNIQEVMAENRARQTRARQLNVRAGEAVFPVLSREQMETWARECLGGARCIREINRAESFLLPPLDEAAVTRVFGANSDTLAVLGREVKVEYREGRVPRVCIDFRGGEKLAWVALPDAGIHLPGGREVTMYSAVEGYGYYIESPSSQFKAKASECLNQGLWDRWTARPEISLPNPEDDAATIPFITAVYGQCVATGSELVAFGTVSYDSWNGGWKAVWFVGRQEAETARDAAAQKLVEKQAEARERRDQQAAQQEVEAVKNKFNELTAMDGYGELSYEVRRRVDGCRWSGSSGSASALRQWAVETESLIAEVETALATLAQQRAEEAERRAHASERLAKILADHYAVCPLCGQKWQWSAEEICRIAEGNGTALYPNCSCPSEQLAMALESGYGQTETVSCDNRSASVLWRTRIGEHAVVEVATYHKHGCWNLAAVIHASVLAKAGEITTQQVWRQPTEREMDLASLRALQESYPAMVAQAEAEVRDGSSCKLTFRRGINAKTREEQWEAGSRKSGLLFILDRRQTAGVQEGRSYFCRDTRTVAEASTFKIIAVTAYLEAGRNIGLEIRALETAGQPAVVASVPALETKSETVDLNQVNLSALFGGAAKIRKR